LKKEQIFHRKKSRTFIRKRADLSSEKEQANEPYQAVKKAYPKEQIYHQKKIRSVIRKRAGK